MQRGSFLAQITPVILTYNEAPNIGRVLDMLEWASEVLVVDTGSNDGTLEILSRYRGVRAVHRDFDSHANQWNFAISDQGIGTDWVLALDADYVLSRELVQEIDSLTPSPDISGFETPFRYCIDGKPLRGTLYPPVTTLFRRSMARYEQDGHTQRVRLTGQTRRLCGVIYHDDRKPLGRWLSAQERYAGLEAEFLLSRPFSAQRIQDRLRRLLVITPWLVPLYCLTVKKGAMDGSAGLFYALQRGIAEAILSLKLLQAQWPRPRKEHD